VKEDVHVGSTRLGGTRKTRSAMMARVLQTVLRRTAFVIGGIAVFLALGAIIARGEIRSAILFAIAPERARDAHLVALTDAEGRSLYLLGTIHGAHLETPSFSFLHLQAVIDRLNPELVLVESRPEEIAKGNWGDGPIEMAFASLHAKSKGMAADGFDAWSPENLSGRSSDDRREDRMMANVALRLPGRRVVLVLTGYSHVAELSSRLAAQGWRPRELTGESKRALFDTTGMTLRFPAGMSDAISLRVAQDRAELRTRGRDPERDDGIRLRLRLLQLIHEVGEMGRTRRRRPMRGGPPTWHRSRWRRPCTSGRRSRARAPIRAARPTSPDLPERG
jgi:hypothetical protein